MSYLTQLMSTGETIELVSRRHWVTIARSLVLNGLAIAVLALLTGIAGGFVLQSGHNGWTLTTVVLGGLMLVFVLRIVLELVRWSSTQYAVTTRRVIELSGVFNKVARDSSLDKINDLVLHQSALGRLMDYGDIEIITGSDVGVNRLAKIAHPVRFKKAMLDNKEDFDSLSRITEHPADDIPGQIARLADLRDRGAMTPDEYERKKAELLARL